MQSNFPNLRRLFVEARTDAEESTYSRTAVSFRVNPPWLGLEADILVLQPCAVPLIGYCLQSCCSARQGRQSHGSMMGVT